MPPKKNTAPKKEPAKCVTLHEKVYLENLKDLMKDPHLSTDETNQQLYMFRKWNYITKSWPTNFIPSKLLIYKGRLYAEGNLSLQGIKRRYRGYLITNRVTGEVLYLDIDIVNCHAVLLSQYCKKKNIECPLLDDYILIVNSGWKLLWSYIIFLEKMQRL